MFLEKFKELLKTKSDSEKPVLKEYGEPIKLKSSEIINFVEEKKKSEIEGELKQFSDSVNEIRTLKDNLIDAMKELRDKKHPDKVPMFENVKKNYYTSKKALLEKFKMPEPIAEKINEFNAVLTETIAQLKSITPKEAYVLQFFKKEKKKIQEHIKDMESHSSKLKELAGRAVALKIIEMRKLNQEIEQKERKIEELKSELRGIKEDEIQEKIEKLENDYRVYKKDPRHKELERLKEEKKSLERKREKYRNLIKIHIGELNRALRLLQHQIPIISLEKEIDQLLKGNFLEEDIKIEKIFSELKKAVEHNRINIKGNKRKKVLNICNNPKALIEDKISFKNTEKEISKVNSRIDELSAFINKGELIKESIDAEKKARTKKRVELEDIEGKISELNQEKDSLRKRLQKKVSESIGESVVLN